jgi:hypothetical protein
MDLAIPKPFGLEAATRTMRAKAFISSDWHHPAPGIAPNQYAHNDRFNRDAEYAIAGLKCKTPQSVWMGAAGAEQNRLFAGATGPDARPG